MTIEIIVQNGQAIEKLGEKDDVEIRTKSSPKQISETHPKLDTNLEAEGKEILAKEPDAQCLDSTSQKCNQG